MPDESGRKWTWPASIDPALYHLEANLLWTIPTPDKGPRRYTLQERMAVDRVALARSPQRQRIDPAHTGDRCRSARR